MIVKKRKVECFFLSLVLIIPLAVFGVFGSHITFSVGQTRATTVLVDSTPIDSTCSDGISPQITKVSNKRATSIKYPSSGYASIGLLCSGQFIEKANAGNQKPIASVSKIITMLTVLNKQPIKTGTNGKRIKISKKFYNYYNQEARRGGSRLKLKLHSKIYQKELIKDAMIVSANNAANILAVSTFGSISKYRTAAKAFLKKYNLENTVVGYDASGLDNKTKSTSKDMFEIARLAIQNPTLKSIVNKAKLKVHVNGKVKYIYNTNPMLGYKNYAGIKTGYTRAAGSNLLFAVKFKDNYIIGVVMKQSSSSARTKAVKNLVNSFEEFLK
jgi:D-alanyl-D-alanine carboxypeptidase (penicillin-binding protein 5/6)